MKPVTPSGDDARLHAQVWELLPWMVNGTASEEQRVLVDGHLLQCADCRAELQSQQRLKKAVLQAPIPGVDAEAGLERLLGRVADPAPSDSLLQSQPLPSAPRRGSRLAPVLAAAVVIQAVGLGLLSLHLFNGDRDADRASFRTLSQSPPAPLAATLRVLPDAGMSLADWHALLQAQGLRVVEGPNAMGAYALAPLAPAAGAADAGSVAGIQQRNEQLVRLRATPGIQLAEPLGPMP